MKTRRGLSGIYFKSLNEETGMITFKVFEDLPESEQNRIMEGRPIEWLQSLVKQLGNTLNRISEEFDITTESGEDEG